MNAIPEMVGIRIQRNRTRRGWSLRTLSEKSNVGLNTASRIERGRDATFSSVVAIAAALEISLDVLIAPSPCSICDGFPPPGYTCDGCGRSERKGSRKGKAEGQMSDKGNATKEEM
jgi:transcriptional regulator with XRE-family HTH domain